MGFPDLQGFLLDCGQLLVEHDRNVLEGATPDRRLAALQLPAGQAAAEKAMLKTAAQRLYNRVHE
ncbi:MAG TPA: hypothetical protein VH247_10275 [Thermoleophilaceae bacterium]|nr:hypothetical protein [Thermoleophilaceae bacterium]